MSNTIFTPKMGLRENLNNLVAGDLAFTTDSHEIYANLGGSLQRYSGVYIETLEYTLGEQKEKALGGNPYTHYDTVFTCTDADAATCLQWKVNCVYDSESKNLIITSSAKDTTEKKIKIYLIFS